MRVPIDNRRYTAVITAVGAALSGVVYALAFLPVGHPLLAWVALVPLLVAVVSVGPWAATGLGLIFVLSAGSVLASWLPAMLMRFFDLDAGPAGLAGIGVMLLCGYPVVAFCSFVSWSARRAAIGPGTVAMAWGACEALRVYGPVETPWGLLAYTQAGWLRFVQSADLVGPIGLGMLIMAATACLAAALAPTLRPPNFRSRVLAVVAIGAAVWLYGGSRLQDEMGFGDPIAVAVVQGAVTPENRFQPEHRGANLDRYLSLTRSLPEPSDLVAWPEFALDFHVWDEPALWDRVVELSREGGAELLVGAPHTRERALLREELNSALLVREGRVVDRHDKLRLMPFSESRPSLLPIGTNRYRPGLELRPLESEAAPLGVVLCSEALHPALVGKLVAQGAGLIVNPSNDDWFASEAAAHHQIAVARFRAVENRRPFLRPSTSGRSVVVDAHGRILADARFGEPQAVQARVRAGSDHTVYGRWLALSSDAGPGIALVPVFYLAATRRRRA